jgi:hypothetical protein
MQPIKTTRALTTAALVLTASSLFAQAPKPAAPPAAGQVPVHAAPVPEPKLVFDREVFSYPGGGRRDPFKPLIGKESLGPLFDDLKLKGIIYTPTDPNRSVALIEDGAHKLYRLRRGDLIGNSRIVEIQALAVRFAVENFGMMRNEVLELRKGAASAAGMQTSSAPIPAAAPGTPDSGFTRVDAATAQRMVDSLARERANRPKTVKIHGPNTGNPNNNDWPIQPEARR